MYTVAMRPVALSMMGMVVVAVMMVMMMMM